MNIKTNTTDRRALAKALGEHLGTEISYLGPPSFAYSVGDLTICRDGSIEGEDAQVQNVLPFLEEHSYIDTVPETMEVNVPIAELDGIALRNLVFMLHSKQYLLNRVLGGQIFQVSDELVDALTNGECIRASEFHSIVAGIEDGLTGLSFTEENATFAFPITEPEKNRAMTEVCAMMVASSKEAKRVDPKELKPENEKYYLRIWLLRLGFNGKGGQATRHAMLTGLKGHTAFRTPEEAERFKQNQKAKHEAKRAAVAVSSPDANAEAEPIPEVDWQAVNRADGEYVAAVNETFEEGAE